MLQFDNRFERVLSAAAHFIQSVVEVGSYVGIVQFNNVALVCSRLVQINSQVDRENLLASLPVVSDNTSSHYGIGLLSSLQARKGNAWDEQR